MSALRFRADPAAVLSLALLYSTLDNRELAALLSAVVLHELGHILAMGLLGLRPCALHLELTGLCIRYEGNPGRWGQFLTAAAGPALGLIYAQLASAAGWELAAGLSLLLSLFNLLPVRPLDGWQMATSLWSDARGEHVITVIGLITSLSLLVLGCVCVRQGSGYALCAVGTVLTLSQVLFIIRES